MDGSSIYICSKCDLGVANKQDLIDCRCQQKTAIIIWIKQVIKCDESPQNHFSKNCRRCNAFLAVNKQDQQALIGYAAFRITYVNSQISSNLIKSTC